MNNLTNSKYLDFLKLENGKRYTLLFMNDFGIGASVIRFTAHLVTIDSYAQYEDSVRLIFIPYKKRGLREIRFYGDRKYAIYEGWIEYNDNPFTPFSKDEDCLVQRSKYQSFDPRYLTDALNEISQKPILSNIKNEV